MHKRGIISLIGICLLFSIGILACKSSDADETSVVDYEHNPINTRLENITVTDTENTYHEDAGLVAADDKSDDTTMTAKVTATALNVRTAPSLESEVITTVRQGTVFECLEQGAEWHKVMYDGQEAYVYAAYVNVTTGNGTDVADNGTGNLADSEDTASYAYSHLEIVEITELYTYDMMCEDIDELMEEYTGLVSGKPIATSADSRFIYEVTVGKSNATKHVVIYAGMHGSERIGSLLAMKQIENYLYDFDKYNDLFDDVMLHVFPMVNPDSVTLSQFGDDGINNQEYRDSVRRWYFRDIALQINTLGKPDYYSKWKANLKGVDIYYNFPYKWEDFKGNIVPGVELYKGEYALSEEESNALFKQVKKIMPEAVIGYHASGEEIYWDFGQTGDIYGKSKSLYEKIEKVTGYAEADTSQIVGGFDAWVINEWNIPAIMLKVGSGELPVGVDEFDKIWRNNRDLWEVFN